MSKQLPKNIQKTENIPVISAESGLRKYLSKINNIASLSPEEEYLLAKNYLEKHAFVFG